VAATKAAIEEGIIPGGGTALIKAGVVAANKKPKSDLRSKYATNEFDIGYEVLLSALEFPLRQILVNAGKDDAGIIIGRIKAASSGAADSNCGYNAFTDEEVDDMIKAGIIDPVKVARTALQNAASAGAILLTTEVAIAEKPKPSAAGPAMPGGMEGMGY